MLDFFPPENYEFPDEKYKIEKWEYVTDQIIPGIVPNRYMISTWGRFYDCFNGHYYPTANVRCKDYPCVHIQFIDGTYKTIKIHHIMMKRFKPFDYDPEQFTDIDHKDGIRYHNWIWNIERVTHQENIIRCVKNGQYPLAENQQNAVLTNEQVHKICELISEGLKVSDIIKLLKDEIPVISRHLVNDIKGGRNYTSISCNYNFENMYYNNTHDQKYDDEKIHNLCQIFETYGTDIKPIEAAELMSFDLPDESEQEQMHFRDVFYNVKKKKIYKNICNQYNY